MNLIEHGATGIRQFISKILEVDEVFFRARQFGRSGSQLDQSNVSMIVDAGDAQRDRRLVVRHHQVSCMNLSSDLMVTGPHLYSDLDVTLTACSVVFEDM
ncbi:MAG: hypothetical protein IID41_18165 [Planctomycetes bacterium]|nr:hypothetical protein [Planctomycetota bacterium]